MKTLAMRSRHERGMTLIELMVALTLGLMVVLVVGQVFYSNKTVFRSQAAQAEVQEKGRFALRWVSEQLRQAGYVDTTRLANGLASNFPISNPTFASAGTVLLEASGTLNYRFYGNGDNQIVDCQGSPVASAVITNFAIARTASDVMTCTSAGSTSTVLSGVKQLVLMYGEDLSTPADNVPDIYRSAASVANWMNVHVVQVCILVESDTQYTAPSGYSVTDCNGSAYPAAGVSNNGKLARTFRTSIFLRNNLS
ncbi:PilW family protein [Chromobacterium haemolyticum]|uniref:PilW family protein n=2 Tax=Chromobacterium haemolyticum TaxID=394935 RepID=A0ABS3GP51_9NEIS|nr:PilW family protein [Chromobacterium haemolyticum]MBK0414624.1 PilW family protein [Chromobacterium haemolyticum]MBO0416003.1 PilW family protein [Chromobacterium haemolyticum]MBO0499498.1 PilW family protein [Chromobacterium haemolyticum]MDH0343009.1 PilW family protein [Chromobacterium haemolyticum]BBH10879.1 hypothetical protein CH06BL_01270 [Chromobacterium haemolyticum]